MTGEKFYHPSLNGAAVIKNSELNLYEKECDLYANCARIMGHLVYLCLFNFTFWR